MTEAGARVLLLVSVLSPAAGALLLGRDRSRARQSALATTVFTLILCLLLIAAYPPGAKEFARLTLPWTPGTSPDHSAPMVSFSLALDGLSLWLYGLTALLGVVGVLISWEAIQEEAARFYRCWLLLETGMLGVFLAQDILLFYVFFEFTLVPLFVLIGVWGSEERQYAALKFFLFTLAGSVLTFLGLLAVVLWVQQQTDRLTFSIPDLTDYLQNLHGGDRMPLALQLVIFWALFAGFAIKVPLFPLHTWLPLAHVEAPAAGSVVLAGVLLKVGGYGFLRFNIPMLPEATAVATPYLLILSVAGIVYGALVALAQKDLKRLIAYSSISHLGFCMMGIFALNRAGLQGGVLQMLNHGLSTGALFALVGMMYERYHTRQMADLGGLARRLPWLAFFMVLASLASIGLPGLNGFVGEFLTLWGMFHRAWAAPPAEWAAVYRLLSVAALSGVVLGAWYMLWMLERVFFGPLREPAHGTAGEQGNLASGEEHPTDRPGHGASGASPSESTEFRSGLTPSGGPGGWPGRSAESGGSAGFTGSGGFNGSGGVAGSDGLDASGGFAGSSGPGGSSNFGGFGGVSGSTGPGGSGGPGQVQDLCWREILALAPLGMLMLWIGLYPKFFLDRIAPTVQELSAPAARLVLEHQEAASDLSSITPSSMPPVFPSSY